MKLYWYLVRKNYDGKMFVMYGNTKPNNEHGVTGLFELTTTGFRFTTPYGTVRNVSSADYDESFYTIVKKVEVIN